MKSRASTSAGDRGCMTIDAGAAADPGVVAPGAAEEGSASSMTTSLRGPRGWHTRGYLPHCDSSGLFQSVTFRLSDSLPRETLDRLDAELAQLPSAHRDRARRARIEAWLDAGSGCCALRHPAFARYVQDAFLHFHGQRYQLHAWCVMPNHVHVLIQPMSDLSLIVQGWKSFTARWMFKHAEALGVALPPGKALWMREYWDRYVRDERHYLQVVEYIHQNPVKAGLCASAEAWPWSSAGCAVVDVG